MATDRQVDRLEAALAQLAEAQARTERALAALTERVDHLTERVDRLTEAQTRSDQALQQLAEQVSRLSEAQTRTEQVLQQLTEQVRRLWEVQTSTDHAVRGLSVQVGRLSETVGFTLEDLARDLAPDYLARRHQIEVAVLERRYFIVDSREIEVDLYGEGMRDQKPVVIVGEVKSRIHGDDVGQLMQKIALLAPQLRAPAVPVLFGFAIHPSAREAAARSGAIVLAAAGR